MSWRSLRSLLKQFIGRLDVDIRLLTLIIIHVCDIFQLNLDGKGMRTVPCVNEVCNGARKVCKLGEKYMYA